MLFRLQEDIFFFSSVGLGVAYAAIKNAFQIVNIK